MDKKIIRKQIQEKLKKISEEDRKIFEEILYKKLYENGNFKNRDRQKCDGWRKSRV